MSLAHYLNGDDSALNDAIVECMPLVDEIVEQFVAKNGLSNLIDDFKSEGYLTLVQSLPEFREVQQPDLTVERFLHTNIRDRLFEIIPPELNLGMSRRTKKRKEQTAQAVPNQLPVLADRDTSHDPTALIDLRLTIEQCCQSHDEHMIVDMKERGFTEREIAKELGISLGSVQNSIKSIYQRLQQELSDENPSGLHSRPDEGHQVLQSPSVRRRTSEARSLGV